MFRAQSLVEFPPAIAYGRLFFASNDGIVFAIGAKNGKRAWKYDSGRCVAASPAVDGNLVYETFLNAPPCNRHPSGNLTGELIAFNVGSGSVVWRKLIRPSESSPLVTAGVVIVGDWSGRVYAFARRTGDLEWTAKLNGNRVYIGDYSGHVYALALHSGRIIWQASAQPRFGNTGTFYATPTVAYGRVYVGATDGKMYSFGATSGKLRWSQSTGGYVYSSAGVWRDRVFAGSYSGKFFAFDAATGTILWQFKADGPISGSPTVIAGRVYFATLKGTTYALDARTGQQVWTFPDGKYSPVVADQERMYLVGYTRIYGLDEKR
jgi:outer membrane protein assembly factor BamB